LNDSRSLLIYSYSRAIAAILQFIDVAEDYVRYLSPHALFAAGRSMCDATAARYDDMATLILNPLSNSIKQLLHQPLLEPISLGTCAVFFGLLAVTSCMWALLAFYTDSHIGKTNKQTNKQAPPNPHPPRTHARA